MDVDAVLREAYCQATPDDHAFVRANFPGVMSMGADFGISYDSVAWEHVPSTYVVCANDRATQPEFERRWAKDRATDWVEWPTDHCPQTSAPERVAELLVRLAQG